jgi:hypothetical protein
MQALLVLALAASHGVHTLWRVELARVWPALSIVPALAKELVRRGDDARIFLPLYGSIDRRRWNVESLQPICVHMGGEEIWAGLCHTLLEGLGPVSLDPRRAVEMRGGGRDAADYGRAREAVARAFPPETIA